jgi:DNA-directed RNA polymerase specialized sigma24 family protein
MAEPLEALLHRAYRYALALTGDPVVAEDSAVPVPHRPQPVDRPAAPGADRAVRAAGPRAPGPRRGLPTGEAGQLLAALAQLRDEEREALFLCAVEGWTAQEVSDRTGQPRGTVLSLIHRGRIRLRELLGLETKEVVP